MDVQLLLKNNTVSNVHLSADNHDWKSTKAKTISFPRRPLNSIRRLMSIYRNWTGDILRPKQSFPT